MSDRADAATPVTPGPAGGSNGLAVAAMVLGIVGTVLGLVFILFFLAIPLGILAAIFGFVGLNAAKQRSGAGKGQAIAGLALGGVAISLGIFGIVAINSFFDDLENDLDDVEFTIDSPVSADDYDVTIDKCAVEANEVVIAGTIENTSDSLQAFDLTFFYRVGSDDDTVSHRTGPLRAGEAESFELTPFGTVAGSEVACEFEVESP